VRALDGESRSLDRWILERGAPQTVTFYRKGLELVRNLNEQGLTQIEQAMSWEANSAVFTPLFLRYISLTQAWEAYVREAQFFDRLVQQYPSSPQVQAAAAVRRSAQTQVQFFEIGIREIEQAFEQERETGRFQIAALDAVLAQAASTRHMMIPTQSASSSTNR